jgi:hypothetical protein
MRQDVFRVAYDEANAELLAITKKFEELRQRKESLEGVVTVLGPILGIETPSPAAARPAEASSTVQPASLEPANYTFNEVSAPLPELEESISDPFQRRVSNALKSNSNNGHGHHGLQPAV